MIDEKVHLLSLQTIIFYWFNTIQNQGEPKHFPYFPQYVNHKYQPYKVAVVAVNATFNNISVISWRSVLLVEETGGPGENHRPIAGH
jgi:hypothetical protein